ncbi:MAG: DMT family transporter [Candidatus Dependentiae bacterium]
MFLILLLYALFATSFPMSKILLSYVTPIFYTGIRMVIAGALLLGYERFYVRQRFSFHKKDLWLLAQIIFFGIYITYILRFWGLTYLPSSKTAFLFNVAPFFSSFYSYLIFKEKPTLRQWIGLAIGFIGIIPLLMTTSKSEQIIGEISFVSWPELAILGAVAAHSYSWIVMRQMVRHRNHSPSLINGFSMFIGGLFALATGIFTEGIQPIPSLGSFIGWLLLIILISNIICHNLYAHLLKRYTATFLSFAGFLGPLFTAFYGWLILHETITWNFVISAVIVFIGLYLFYGDELKNPIDPESDLAT